MYLEPPWPTCRSLVQVGFRFMRKSSEMEPRGGGLVRSGTSEKPGPGSRAPRASARPSSDLSHGRGPTRRGCGAERGLGTPGLGARSSWGPQARCARPASRFRTSPGRRRRTRRPSWSRAPARPPWRSPGRARERRSRALLQGEVSARRGARGPGRRRHRGAGVAPEAGPSPRRSPQARAATPVPPPRPRLTRKPSGVGGGWERAVSGLRRAPSPVPGIRVPTLGPRLFARATPRGLATAPPAGRAGAPIPSSAPKHTPGPLCPPGPGGGLKERPYSEKPGVQPHPRLPPPSSGPSWECAMKAHAGGFGVPRAGEMVSEQ